MVRIEVLNIQNFIPSLVTENPYLTLHLVTVTVAVPTKAKSCLVLF